MRYTIWFVLLAIGCGDSGELAALKSLLANAQESIVDTQAKQIDKTDEAIGILKDNTTALAAIKADIEALQVVSNPNGKESDPASALESPAKANTALASVKVATPGTSSSRIASDGTRLRWSIEGDWSPDILETSAHLRTDHGIETNGMTHQEMADIHADLHEGNVTAKVKVVNRGTSCPNGRCPVPQRRGIFGRLFR